MRTIVKPTPLLGKLGDAEDHYAFIRTLRVQGFLLVLAVFKDGLKRPPVHLFFDDGAEFLKAAFEWNARGFNVYHGCAAYRTALNRKGENVGAVFVIWLDLDVGPTKPYGSKREAVAAYERFRRALGLPLCTYVDSGNGIHIYQPLTKPITPEQWDRLAALYAQCLDHFGVKHDTSRTQDKASILRVPGTANHKTDTPKPVEIKSVGEAAPASEYWAKLKAYADANGLFVGVPKTKGKLRGTNDIIGNRNYPPAKAENIVARCAVLREVAETGGDVPYEVWWRALGVAKHTTEPDKVAAQWTRNRAATGHDKDDWKGLMDAWGAGPTTCAQFALHSDKCVSCQEVKGAV